MPSGFKVADAYVSVTLDRDQLRSDIAGLPADIGSDVDKAGQDAGKRLGKGLGDGADGSAVGRRIGDDLDKELGPRATKSGDDSGNKLSQGMQLAIVRNSPVIAAAIAGIMTAGAPVAIAGATSMLVAIAALAVHSNDLMQASFNDTSDTIKKTFTDAAQVDVPFFLLAMSRIKSAATALGPQLRDAFASLDGPIENLATGLINLVQNAMPGILATVQASGPVFVGLRNLLSDIGSGLGSFFQIISQHVGDAGTVFTALGGVIRSLLPILGELIGAGADLAATVLPPLAGAVRGVAAAVSVLSPLLPAVLGGLLGWMALSALGPIITSLSTGLLTLATRLEGLAVAGLLERASYGLAAFAGILGPVGLAIGVVVAVLPSFINWLKGVPSPADRVSASMGTLTQALSASKGAIDANVTAAAALILQQNGLFESAGKWGVSTGLLTQAALGNKAAMDQVTAAHDAYDKSLGSNVLGLQQYNGAAADAKTKSDEQLAAIQRLASGTDAGVQKQKDLKAAVDGATASASEDANQISVLADKANTAQAAINLLATALSSLTGGTVSTLQAQAQLETTVASAATAMKNQHGEVLNASGGLDLFTESGRAAEQVLVGIAQQGNTYVSALKNSGAAAADVAAANDNLRGEFVKAASQMGITGAAAQTLADQILGIPSERNTVLTADTADADSKVAVTQGKVDKLGASTPTPKASMDTTGLDTSSLNALAKVGQLAGQRPTPIAGLDMSPFQGAASGVFSTMANLNGLRAFPWATLNASTAGAEAALNYAARNRTSYVTQLVTTKIGAGAYGAATGGRVGDVIGLAGKRFDVGGKLSGPGGATDDLIQAVTNTGVPLRVSNDEWVIKGSSSAKYGDAKMAAINAGTAVVSVPGPHPAGRTATGSSGGMSVGELHVHLEGTWDFSNPSSARAIAVGVQQAMIKLEREQR